MHSTRNNWNLALSLSLIAHIAVFVAIPGVILKNNTVNTKNKPNKEIEIITETIKKPIAPMAHKEYKKMKLREPPPPYLNNIMDRVFVGKNAEGNISKPPIFNDNLKNIILAKLPREKELKKNPAYMDYYHLIRERIRSKAYRYYNSSNQGQVLLTFIISSNGKLENLYLDDGSSMDKNLIEISLKSIREASPFPSFPPELKYPRLQFNISIYFKTN